MTKEPQHQLVKHMMFLRCLFSKLHDDLREVSTDYELIGIMKKHQRQSQDWAGVKHALLCVHSEKEGRTPVVET